MLISYRHRFIFIHVWRTGGMSVTQALRPFTEWPEESISTKAKQALGFLPRSNAFPAHAGIRDLHRELTADSLNSFFKFAIVRNPWDWQVSLYSYIRQNARHRQHDLVCGMDSFEEYLHWRTAHHCQSQSDFITDPDGRLLVDFVGRYENLERDFAVICSHLGVRTTLPKINGSSHPHYSACYNERCFDLVAEGFQQDINLLGYGMTRILGSAISRPDVEIGEQVLRKRRAA